MRTILLIGLAVLAPALAAGLAPGAAAQDAIPGQPPCAGPESGQFDFWVGEWEVYVEDRLVGYNTVSMILEGCALMEEYEAAEGEYQGKSFSFFDPQDGLWHQIWVDNRGVRLTLKGWLTGLGMTLSGDRILGTGTVTDRITWTDRGDGTVRQLWEQTADGGMSWQVLFDGHYRPAGDR